jgi:hypothetical protein
MLREFASRFFHQLLELRTLRCQAALQRPGAQAQVAGDVPQSRPLACEKFLHNSFYLFRERFLSQLQGQFVVQLRRDQGEELGVVCQEGPIDVCFISSSSSRSRRRDLSFAEEIARIDGNVNVNCSGAKNISAALLSSPSSSPVSIVFGSLNRSKLFIQQKVVDNL